MAAPQDAAAAAKLVPDTDTTMVVDDDEDDESTRFEDNLGKLLLYRAWYDDDAAWENFLRVLWFDDNWSYASDDDADENDDGSSSGERVSVADLPYTIMDDRAAYDGASKDDIRVAFQAWIAARSPERDGPGVRILSGRHASVPLYSTPRYRFCIYADRDTILSASVTPWTRRTKDGRFHRGYAVKGHAVIVDARFDPNPSPPVPDEDDLEDIASGHMTYEEWLDIVTEDDHGFEPVEGRDARDVGWCFVWLRGLYGLVEALKRDTSSSVWEHYYKRPPMVYPDGRLLTEAQ